MWLFSSVISLRQQFARRERSFNNFETGASDRGSVNNPDSAVGVGVERPSANFGIPIPDINRRGGAKVQWIVHGRRLVIRESLSAYQHQTPSEIILPGQALYVRPHSQVVVILVYRSPGKIIDECQRA